MSVDLSVSFDVTTLPDNKALMLTVAVATASGMSDKIFAIQVGEPQNGTNVRNDRFSHVCTIYQLEELSDNPQTTGTFYRVNKVELVLNSSEQLNTVLALLKNDIKYLVSACRAADMAASDPEIVVF